MADRSSNKTIAKNTIFLYFRMMFTMVVSLYTSRVILQQLGIDDYGIYQAVGGIVGMLSFVNTALSGGSSRFLTFELGTGNFEKLKRTFSTTLTIQLTFALILALVAETLGLWFLNNKMVIAPDRMYAATWVYHISILTAVFNLLVVPYNASIISHERMGIYAYVSIVEVSLKLLVVYCITIGGYDKLIMYAILLCLVQIVLFLFYKFYCNRNFKETYYNFSFDKEITKSIAGFSGWSLLAQASIALNSQGILILLNMFFTPAVVTARSISIQVNMAATQFVNNFRTAVNPQIVKRYAAQDYQGSKDLLLSSTKYSYYMMLALCLPIVVLAYPLLKLWLGIVPEYTVIFLQLIIIQSLFQVFDTSFYTALYAKGRLKENALLSPTLGFVRFPIIYLLFKAGFSPVALSWASLLTYVLLGLVIKPLLIVKIVDYTWKEIWSVFLPCIWVTLCAVPVPLFLCYCLDVDNNLIHDTMLLFITLLSVALAVWYVGLNKEMREKLISVIKSKIPHK